MIKKLGELKVNKSDDYYDKIVQTLEKAGFIIVLELETSLEKHYIVAESEDKEWRKSILSNQKK